MRKSDLLVMVTLLVISITLGTTSAHLLCGEFDPVCVAVFSVSSLGALCIAFPFVRYFSLKAMFVILTLLCIFLGGYGIAWPIAEQTENNKHKTYEQNLMAQMIATRNTTVTRYVPVYHDGQPTVSLEFSNGTKIYGLTSGTIGCSGVQVIITSNAPGEQSLEEAKENAVSVISSPVVMSNQIVPSVAGSIGSLLSDSLKPEEKK